MRAKPPIRAFFDERPGLTVGLWAGALIGAVVLVIYLAIAPTAALQAQKRQCARLCQPRDMEVVNGDCMCQRADGSWRSFEEPVE